MGAGPDPSQCAGTESGTVARSRKREIIVIAVLALIIWPLIAILVGWGALVVLYQSLINTVAPS